VRKALYLTRMTTPDKVAGPPLPVPKIGRMGYNPANFAYTIGTGPWVPGYAGELLRRADRT
jgi:hypothetical protein